LRTGHSHANIQRQHEITHNNKACALREKQ
jgi:hypothetical protein